MKYKIGDRVKVREDLGEFEKIGRVLISEDMVELAGQEVIIGEVFEDIERYEINDNYWYWTDEMLRPIEDPLAKKIEERNNKQNDDKVNSPSHYTKGDIEVIDIIKQLTQGYEPFEAYLVGNTIKYLARANYKENKQQDLEKAEWHIIKLLEEQNK